jgi:hypothetical protein
MIEGLKSIRLKSIRVSLEKEFVALMEMHAKEDSNTAREAL